PRTLHRRRTRKPPFATGARKRLGHRLPFAPSAQSASGSRPPPRSLPVSPSKTPSQQIRPEGSCHRACCISIMVTLQGLVVTRPTVFALFVEKQRFDADRTF